MKCTGQWMAVAAVLAMAIIGCDKNDNKNETNAADLEFIRAASISNNAEVAAGRLAATKGNTPMVRAFGSSMISEHTSAQEDLRNRASSVGVTASDTVDAEHRAAAAYLNSLSGYSFDTAYMNRQVADHAKTLNIFDTEISNGRHENIRSFAVNLRPHIQMHYTRADSIRRAL